MSERVERRILALLGDRLESPYGNPIPGLGELDEGLAGVPQGREGLVSLVTLVRGGSALDVVIRRIGEPVQVDPASRSLSERSGVVPGARVRVEALDDGVLVRGSGGESLELPMQLAMHVYVAEGADAS